MIKWVQFHKIRPRPISIYETIIILKTRNYVSANHKQIISRHCHYYIEQYYAL